MRRHIRKRKCQHCKACFDPDPRNVGRQRYCSQPPCRQASKAASQRRWLSKPENREYFCGPVNVQRVQQWRKHHPGYWRRTRAPALDALQEPCTPQELETQSVKGTLKEETLQDSFFLQPTVLVGLIAHLTGLSLQDDIALTARRLQQLGRDILHGSPPEQGGRQHAQTPHLFIQDQESPHTIQLGGSTAGP